MNELDEFSAGLAEAGIVIFGLAKVFRILPPADARVFGGVALDNLQRTIRRAVIGDENFKAAKILLQNRIKAFRQKPFAVVNGNEHTHFRRGGDWPNFCGGYGGRTHGFNQQPVLPAIVKWPAAPANHFFKPSCGLLGLRPSARPAGLAPGWPADARVIPSEQPQWAV